MYSVYESLKVHDWTHTVDEGQGCVAPLAVRELLALHMASKLVVALSI